MNTGRRHALIQQQRRREARKRRNLRASVPDLIRHLLATDPASYLSKLLLASPELMDEINKIYHVGKELNPDHDHSKVFPCLTITLWSHQGQMGTHVVGDCMTLEDLLPPDSLDRVAMAIMNTPSPIFLDLRYQEGEETWATLMLANNPNPRPVTPTRSLSEALREARLNHKAFQVYQREGRAFSPFTIPGKRGIRVDDIQQIALRHLANEYRRSGPIKTITRPTHGE